MRLSSASIYKVFLLSMHVDTLFNKWHLRWPPYTCTCSKICAMEIKVHIPIAIPRYSVTL